MSHLLGRRHRAPLPENGKAGCAKRCPTAGSPLNASRTNVAIYLVRFYRRARRQGLPHPPVSIPSASLPALHVDDTPLEVRTVGNFHARSRDDPLDRPRRTDADLFDRRHRAGRLAEHHHRLRQPLRIDPTPEGRPLRHAAEARSSRRPHRRCRCPRARSPLALDDDSVPDRGDALRRTRPRGNPSVPRLRIRRRNTLKKVRLDHQATRFVPLSHQQFSTAAARARCPVDEVESQEPERGFLSIPAASMQPQAAVTTPAPTTTSRVQ